LLALALLLLVLGAWLSSAIRSSWLRLRLFWRFRWARQAQVDAERLLSQSGYRILDRQACREIVCHVDGAGLPAQIKPDLLVERKGRRYVVEVKTGERAPDPAYIPTRRQLLEYAVAYPDHGLLLLDMENVEEALVSAA
jgi:hypothetical protein